MEPEKPNAPIAKPRRRRLWTILLALAIFSCGVLVGGGLTFKIITIGYKRAFQEPEVLAEKITRRMERQLDLNNDQLIQVRRIILEQQKALQALRKEFRPRLDGQLEKTRLELAAVLTPEQARKWEKRFAHIRKFWLPPLPGDSRDSPPGGANQ
jgi:hypothetical protein